MYLKHVLRHQLSDLPSSLFPREAPGGTSTEGVFSDASSPRGPRQNARDWQIYAFGRSGQALARGEDDLKGVG